LILPDYKKLEDKNSAGDYKKLEDKNSAAENKDKKSAVQKN
jgi:hypothetical protein